MTPSILSMISVKYLTPIPAVVVVVSISNTVLFFTEVHKIILASEDFLKDFPIGEKVSSSGIRSGDIWVIYQTLSPLSQSDFSCVITIIILSGPYYCCLYCNRRGCVSTGVCWISCILSVFLFFNLPVTFTFHTTRKTKTD